ncbi:GntR family transcriptional regulator [Alkalicoccus chagannorensis]|uniref:GntR family transcriptional regulator n=1 Tax=Alkalicoccus chagannorensis TaxID=427072 RepID=UPI0004049E98|nr:GntR family transcriptional regulator [Alkalicoccus chagannorensis]
MNEIIKKEKPLHLQSYDILRGAIIGGEWEPGMRLTEASLSREIGVSRATIREALKMLQQDGLIFHDGTALRIIEPTLKMAEALYVCRERLESLAAGLMAEQKAGSGSDALRIILNETEKALEVDDTGEIVRLNTAFHQTIIDYCENEELQALMKTVQAKVTFIRSSLHQQNFRREHYLKEHQQICEAVAAGNKELAESAMSNHLQKDLETVRKWFSNRDDRLS